MSKDRTENSIKLHIDKRMLHVLYMGIIEHWEMPRFKLELTTNEFELLHELRKKLHRLRENQKISTVRLTDTELHVLTKAYAIGLEELDPIEFPTVVGESYAFGKAILEELKEVACKNEIPST